MKRLILASALCFVAAIVIGFAGIGYILSHPIPGVSSDDRAAQLGSGAGVVTAIAFGVIWLPFAFKYGQKRRDQQARNRRRR
ncbi:MAG: hypothetical protein JWN86_1722 [Planctomycetota bacterium]|nr:hypothetical protein [Planctomycetota bacterium]